MRGRDPLFFRQDSIKGHVPWIRHEAVAFLDRPGNANAQAVRPGRKGTVIITGTLAKPVEVAA